MLTQERIKEVLKKVIDPELGLSIVDLGLIYGIEIKNNNVVIKMTLTVPGCPLANALVNWTKEAVLKMEEVKNVEIQLVWDPPWNPSMMSDYAKKILGWGKN